MTIRKKINTEIQKAPFFSLSWLTEKQFINLKQKTMNRSRGQEVNILCRIIIVMVAIIYTFPSYSQILPIDQKYQDLNLITEFYDNPYNLPDVSMYINSKYGVSSETFYGLPFQRSTFKYEWDLSQIPESSYPIEIAWFAKNFDISRFTPINISANVGVIVDESQEGRMATFNINSPLENNIFWVQFNLKSYFYPFDYVSGKRRPLSNDKLRIVDKNEDEVVIAEAQKKQGGTIIADKYFETEWLLPFQYFPNFQSYHDYYVNYDEELHYEELLDNGNGVSIMYEPTSSQNNFVFDQNHAFEDFKIYLGENASLIVDSDLTLLNCKIIGFHNMWDKIVVKPGATLTLNNCLIEDGLQGIVVEEGGTLKSYNSTYFSNYRSISVLKSDAPPFSDFANLSDMSDNYFYSTIPNNVDYDLATYFYDLPGVPSIPSQQPRRNGLSYCGLYVDRARVIFGEWNNYLEGEGANVMKNMANGIVTRHAKLTALGLIIDGMQHNIQEEYDVAGYGIHGRASYLGLNGFLGVSNSSHPETYTISDCETAIKNLDSYNTVVQSVRIRDCVTGIEIEHFTGDMVTEQEFQSSLQLYDNISNSKIEECKHAINIFPWTDVYYNMIRTAYIYDNSIISDRDGASGITSTGFSHKIYDNQITLSSNNQELGDAAIRIINKSAYVPDLIPEPESIPTYEFIDGGSKITGNYIEISEVKDGISTSAGRFNKIADNTLFMHNDAQENTTRQNMISSMGSRAEISNNEVFEEDLSNPPAYPFLQTGINLENSINSLVSCNTIQNNRAITDLLILGDNAGTDIRGNKFTGVNANNSTNKQIRYGRVSEPYAVTGKQIHRGNEFIGANQSVIHYGGGEAPENNQYIVASGVNAGFYVPADINPPSWFWIQDFSEQADPSFRCEDLEGLVEHPYLTWYGQKVGKEHLSDSLFINRLHLGFGNANLNYPSKDYFDLEYGMDLYENDSIINTPAFSSFKNEFLNHNYDQLFDLRQGIAFKTENPLESDPHITSTELENYWNSVDTTKTTLVSMHIASFENALDDMNPGSSEYLLKNEVDIHTVLHALLDSTESIGNYATLLYNIATECPYQGGKSVYFARFLHNKYISPVDFEAMDLCATANLRFNTEEESTVESLLLSPNPVKDQLFLNREFCQYKIYSIDGKLHQEARTRNGKIDVSRLGNGIYILEIHDKDGEAFISKFIKQ